MPAPSGNVQPKMLRWQNRAAFSGVGFPEVQIVCVKAMVSDLHMNRNNEVENRSEFEPEATRTRKGMVSRNWGAHSSPVAGIASGRRTRHRLLRSSRGTESSGGNVQ